MKDRTFNFARLFVQETGMTPAKFVEQARLEAARCTLEQTALPVEAIAERCGFGDPSACAGASAACSGSARRTTARASSLRYCTERLVMGRARPSSCWFFGTTYA
ncbi:MAG: helix-turn-helix domain-containing protein [bacterium]